MISTKIDEWEICCSEEEQQIVELTKKLAERDAELEELKKKNAKHSNDTGSELTFKLVGEYFAKQVVLKHAETIRDNLGFCDFTVQNKDKINTLCKALLTLRYGEEGVCKFNAMPQITDVINPTHKQSSHNVRMSYLNVIAQLQQGVSYTKQLYSWNMLCSELARWCGI